MAPVGSSLRTSWGPWARYGLADIALAGVLALAGGFLLPTSAHWSTRAFLNFGPNDESYVVGFREDWEPEGRTRFHWTGVRASVELPVVVRGHGHVLRLRARRHFLEPASVTLRVEGRRAGEFEVSAADSVAWRVLDFPLPPLAARERPFQLQIEAPSANPRPLGVALDWMELTRDGGARFELLPATRSRLALLLAAAFLVTRLAGLARLLALGFAASLAAAAAAGVAHDILAAERVLRAGTLPFVVVGLTAVGFVRWPVTRRMLRVDAGPGEDSGAAAGWRRQVAGWLVVLVLAALAIRLVLLLHPQFYYPDVRIHAVFARELAKTGLPAFLRDFTANQYRFSLGLQFENGHWYAFPYPPAFYILCWPLLRFARMAPDVAVAVLAAALNSLEALLVFAIGRRLSRLRGVALLASAFLPLLPIFVIRLSLAYFPALVGHAFDALVLAYLVSRVRELGRPRVVLALAALLCLAFLTYTQSLLNWALLLGLLLPLWWLGDRSRGARRAQLGLATAGILGVLLSMSFYGRYVPVFIGMQQGLPMAEEHVLTEKVERARSRAGGAALPEEEPDDPFAGPGIDPWRGARKAAWRLFLFYNVFAVAVVVGLVVLWRAAPGSDERRLILAWALVYLCLNLASGGLPGPNLVRYNKDLEIVAPLFCLALAHLATLGWRRWRASGVALVLAFQLYAGWRAVHALTDKFFAIR